MVDTLSLQAFPRCMYKWFKLQQTTRNIRSSSGLCSGTYIIVHPTLFDGSMTLYTDDIMIFRPFQTPEDLAILKSDIDRLASWTHKKKFYSLMQTNVSIWLSPENVKQTFPWSPSPHS